MPFFSRRNFLKTAMVAGLGLEVCPGNTFEAWSMRANSPLHVPIASVQPDSPPWTKDLIVYEIATKGFTSPDGPQSGTFNSLRKRLPYLEELGVNGIWLTGYSLCDPHHFYNIWTQYAVIEPDKFDPTLGTAREFQFLISEAHDRKIRIFLDVITHGLMQDSPIVKAHPNWFRGSTWGMADFDWMGGHTDLDDWWVKIYTDFVVRYGVDGYRLDVNIYRPDLWERIRQNAAANGHPIVIWEEANWPIPGVTDFTQRANVIGDTDTGTLNKVLVNNLPGFYDRKFGRAGEYRVEIEYADHATVWGDTNGRGQLHVQLMGATADHVSRRAGDVPARPDGLLDVQLRLRGVERKPIENITVHDDMDQEWKLVGTGSQIHPIFVEAPLSSEPLVVGSEANLYIATIGWGETSVELSCHDNGWEGFPTDKNPYVAQGSRCIFGYSVLLSPMIPIFFSGEEFDATFNPAPDLSPDLYGGKSPGKGRWLYGTMLDWDELRQEKHRDMYNDVKKLIAIRKQYPEILCAWADRFEPNLKAIPYEADIELPVPYLRWKGNRVICVAGNRNSDRDANLKLRIPLESIGLEKYTRYRVRNLWSDGQVRICAKEELDAFPIRIGRDKNAGGGIAIFQIDPVV